VVLGAVMDDKGIEGQMKLNSCEEREADLRGQIKIPYSLLNFFSVYNSCAYELGGMYLLLENIAEYNCLL